jgi:hypothetical protein
MKRRSIGVFLALLTFGAYEMALAGETEIRFPAGRNETVVSDVVIRGEALRYTFRAKAGQEATLGVTSAENNAMMAIFRPGYVTTMVDQYPEVKGQSLPGAAEENDAKSWRGVLPDSGKYLIVVAPDRGNADFKLRVRIK